jgi:hypothetical protein
MKGQEPQFLTEMTLKSGNKANTENEPAEIPTGKGVCENCGQITTDTCPKCFVYIYEFCACLWYVVTSLKLNLQFPQAAALKSGPNTATPIPPEVAPPEAQELVGLWNQKLDLIVWNPAFFTM